MADPDIPAEAQVPTPDAEPPEPDAAARAFARCFAGPDGRLALAHLSRITFERVLGPEASEAALRDLEGQRRLAGILVALIRRGRAGG